MAVEMRLARNNDYDEQLEWMGRSGIELARYALANKCPSQRNIDALNQFWAGGTAPCSNDIAEISLKNVPMGAGSFSVTIVDMERKWDINLVAGAGGAPPQMEVLQRAMNEIGIQDQTVSSDVIDSIIDWVSSSSTARFGGAKNDEYARLSPPYYCKNGILDDLSELLLVKGVTPDIYWGSFSTNHPPSAFSQHGEGAFTRPTQSSLNPFGKNNENPVYPVGLADLFSPMGGKLNINTASLATLQLIPGIDEATAQRIIQQRAGPDGIDGTDDDVPFQNPQEIFSGNIPGGPPMGGPAQQLGMMCDVRSYVFEVHVEAELNGYKRSFIGIVSRGGPGAQQFRCVKFYWN
jgi:general secretion pathway protein K